MRSVSGWTADLVRFSVLKGGPAPPPVLLYESIPTPIPTKNVENAGARSLDTRQQQTNSNAIVSESVNFGVLGTTAFFASCTSGVPFEFIWDENQEIALPPGSQVTIAADQLVDVIIVSFMWRERPIEDSEKT